MMVHRGTTGRPASRSAGPRQAASELQQDLERIGAMNVDALRQEWWQVFDAGSPPAFSKDLLRRAIAYQLQEQALGGLNLYAARMLRTLAKPGIEPPRQVKVGSVIVREHKGVVHEVLVVPGGFCWQGKTYGSLSTIAKTITGVTWNGPRFFGLRSKKQEVDDSALTPGASVAPVADVRCRPGRRSRLQSPTGAMGGDR